jgi:NADPH:quinone reductase-like Zn-dependent oxidoreductase
MARAVRYGQYGGIEVLQVAEVSRPVPGRGQVLVQVRAAGINPGEAKIRNGALAERWPSTFPSGQGTDLAGVVAESGPEAGAFAVGDEVIGFTDNRASHAEFVVVQAGNLVPRPANVPWEAAGGLFVAGTTAYAAVRAVAAGPGDTLVVAGGAGGVGSIAVQLAVAAGATVIGLASEPNHQWLAGHRVTPVSYGAGVADRIRAAAAGRVHAFIDTVGTGYVELALELGVRPDRIDTIADFTAPAKYGVKLEGTSAAATAEVLAELAAMIDKGQLEIPVAAVYPLSEVQAAFRELEQGHTRGKIVLRP